ncbi:hypothetical protein [Streptomyces sp. MP131-18]|uniref:hypothetical protein n=1 Tax=Streptomyces sp. MP131-18 TaxID=1857892 RepID=UPI0009A1E2D3|nr:hypothetical protein [Streptomyces sp. MP131-18]ONK10625.1 hypothetical protein STBA_13480 [Streptomyces sp. MP131-18]
MDVHKAGTDAYGAGDTYRTGADADAELQAEVPANSPAPLIPQPEADRLTAGLHHAVVGFVDSPERSLTEADFLLEETVAQLTEALSTRRRDLRGGWQEEGMDTERQRVLLLDYRELVERLLGV